MTKLKCQRNGILAFESLEKQESKKVHFRHVKIFLLIVVLVSMLFGCAWFSRESISRGTPEAIYQKGYENYHKEKYKKAIESFQRVQEEYPLSKLAIMAEVGIADAFFSNGDYLEAEMSYEDFMNMHPNHENLPYIMYQLGMCHYKQMSDIDRDPSEAQKAREKFERLIARFPSSRFSFMGKKRLRECMRRLGEHEFYVGHFYFKMKKYNAALKRFETVSKQYANLGMDYKVSYFIRETKRLIAEKKNQKSE
jgi:outer membrane protein assembly factor BamD